MSLGRNFFFFLVLQDPHYGRNDRFSSKKERSMQIKKNSCRYAYNPVAVMSTAGTY